MQNILRVHDKKFKSKGHITQAVNHNMRLHIDTNLNERIYSEKSKGNELLYNPLGFNPNSVALIFKKNYPNITMIWELKSKLIMF